MENVIIFYLLTSDLFDTAKSTNKIENTKKFKYFILYIYLLIERNMQPQITTRSGVDRFIVSLQHYDSDFKAFLSFYRYEEFLSFMTLFLKVKSLLMTIRVQINYNIHFYISHRFSPIFRIFMYMYTLNNKVQSII